MSGAGGLKGVTFVWEGDPRWVAMTLRTITCDNRNLQQLSLYAFWESQGTYLGSDDLTSLVVDVGERSYQGWLELDGVLAQLWESHSIRPEVIYGVPRWIDEAQARPRVEKLLPRATTRGIVYMVEQIDGF